MSNKTFQRASISAECAASMIDAAERQAQALGIAIVTVIVDESGITKASRRMDGAPLVAVDAALAKARTAVGFGLATGEPWYAMMKDDPLLLHGAGQLKHFTLLPGGHPVVVDGATVGAIGISGAHYSLDDKCARAALDELER